MEIKVQKRTDNLPLKREEVECVINFDEGTPNKEAIKEIVAKALTANMNLVVINQILQQFGSKEVNVIACVYKNPDAMKRMHKEKKTKKAEGAAPAAPQ